MSNRRPRRALVWLLSFLSITLSSYPAEVARANEEAPSEVPSAENQVQPTDKNRDKDDFAPYMTKLQRSIESHWSPPHLSKSTSFETVFKLDTNGRLLSANVSKSSGNPELDTSALFAIFAAQPFEALPPDYKESVDISVTFECPACNQRNDTSTTSKAVSSPSAIDSTPGSINFAPYMSQLQKTIKSHWTPPWLDESTSLQTTFTIDTNGRVLSMRVSKSSGNQEMDTSAMFAIFSAQPFEALPPNCKEPIDILFTFNRDFPADQIESLTRPYIELVSRLVLSAWAPSRIALTKNARVKFEIGRDGRVLASRIEKSSGLSEVDALALKAVQDAQPFPQLPAELPKIEVAQELGTESTTSQELEQPELGSYLPTKPESADKIYEKVIALIKKRDYLSADQNLRELACGEYIGPSNHEREQLVRIKRLLETSLLLENATNDFAKIDSASVLLGKCKYVMGYHQAALKLFANSLTIREKNFGPFNDYVENHREILAALYVKEKQKLKAIGLYQHALKVTQDKAALAEGNLSLARFYAQIGCHQSAEITYKVALRLLRQSQGPLNPSVINVFRELFCYYARQSNRTAQEQLAKEFVNSCSNSTCAKSLRVTSLGHLAWCYFRLKQYAKAESVLRQELALRDRSGSLLDSGLRVNLLNLAFVLEKLHNLTEAESCSKQLLNICTNESTQNALRAKLLATENLVTVYWKEGKLADAKPLLKQEEYLLSKTNVGGMRHFFDDQRAWFYYASGEYPASQAIFESRLRESNYVDVADLSGLKASYHLDKHEDELLPRLGSIISTRSTLRSDSSWLWNLIVGEFKNKADQGQIESLIKGSLNSSNQSDKEVLYPNFATVLLREHKGAVDFPSFHGH